MIIVLEGFDQAGKGTQSKLLAKYLKSRKLKCKIFSFPDYTTKIGKEVQYYLKGKRKFSPQVIHCLLAANRWEKLEQIEDALAKNYIIIMNRYYQSNLVYGITNGLDLKWLLNLDAGLPKEDLVIVLDVKPKESFSRKKIQRDKFEKNKKFAQKIVGTYRSLAKDFGWKIVDASKTKEEVNKSITTIVSRYIK